MDTHQLQEKWAPVLDHKDLSEIKDPHRRQVTASILENQEKALKEEHNMLTEAAPINSVGADGLKSSHGSSGLAGFDPILISLIRRAMPNLVAYDVCGVQPMSGPTGLIFAMRSHYNDRSGAEALFNEPNPGFSASGDASGANAYDPTAGYVDQGGGGTGAAAAASADNTAEGNNPAILNDGTTYPSAGTGYRYENTGGAARDYLEALGTSGSPDFREMAFTIDKVSVTAKSRALKAEYTLELAQDLKAIHGLDAETELANILSSEILAEINREVIRTIYLQAKVGAQNNVANAGIFNLDTDSNGRWSVEKFKGLIYQIERDANAIAQQTRRGKGNFILCSADVASALNMAGVLDYTPALSTNGLPDDTGNTFVGTLNGGVKVYVDPYSANLANDHFYVAGYKGSSPYDAGMFYCPYVPLQMVRAVDQGSFQPKIGFKTRYGIVANPFVFKADGSTVGEDVLSNTGTGRNQYYRRVLVRNLM